MSVARAEEYFRRIHDSFRQRWMRMNGKREIGGCGRHLDRQHPFRDEFAGARSHYAHAQNALGLGIENKLGQAFGAVNRHGAS